MKLHLDNLAACLSSLCLVHCLALPLVLVALPTAAGVADMLHGPEWVHWLLIALALPVSLLALWRGIDRHHDRRPLALVVAGFALMALGAGLHDSGSIEALLTVAGGLVVALGHWQNWGLQRLAASRCC